MSSTSLGNPREGERDSGMIPEPRSASRNDFRKLNGVGQHNGSSLPRKGGSALPARRLSVRKIKEVLQLKFEVGLGLRAIRPQLLDWARHRTRVPAESRSCRDHVAAWGGLG